MKKLKLNLEELKVESFETSFNLTGKGTILGQSGPTNDNYNDTCVNTECGQLTCNTCYYTCAGYGPTCIYPQCF